MVYASRAAFFGDEHRRLAQRPESGSQDVVAPAHFKLKPWLISPGLEAENTVAVSTGVTYMWLIILCRKTPSTSSMNI